MLWRNMVAYCGPTFFCSTYCLARQHNCLSDCKCGLSCRCFRCNYVPRPVFVPRSRRRDVRGLWELSTRHATSRRPCNWSCHQSTFFLYGWPSQKLHCAHVAIHFNHYCVFLRRVCIMSSSSHCYLIHTIRRCCLANARRWAKPPAISLRSCIGVIESFSSIGANNQLSIAVDEIILSLAPTTDLSSSVTPASAPKRKFTAYATRKTAGRPPT